MTISPLFFIFLSVIAALTVGGSGFLDLSNLVRYFLLGLIIVFALIFALTYRKTWKSKKVNRSRFTF